MNLNRQISMNLKTLVVHVDASRQAATRMALAARLAVMHDAHLVGAAMTGISRIIFEDNPLRPPNTVLIHHVEGLRNNARLALKNFEDIARQAGVTSMDSRLIEDDPESGMAIQTRYADLAVIGQFDPDDPVPGLMSDFPESVFMQGVRPVLIIPFTAQSVQAFARVMIAWDASMSATRAVTGALPLLQAAADVDVVVFNASPQNEAHGELPGNDLAVYLARHGVTVNVINRTTDIDIGNSLLSLCADQGADLLVMGGYGHTRFREILLGGATRTVLESMTLPVLMAH
jgi:nucleotide-binding universal stress UspA family protein